MIIEFENLLSNDKADAIEQFMFGSEINWIYNPQLSGVSFKEAFDNDPLIKDTDGFTHPFVEACKIVSPHVQIIKDIIQAMEETYGHAVIAVERARAVFVHKDMLFGNFYQLPHVDFTTPHMTMIYYVNDCDGDTVFFEEKYTGVNVNTKKTVSRRITPKKNKCVIFDGLNYHTGSVPSLSNRVVLNINFYFKK
jgi:hypothetical protein